MTKESVRVLHDKIWGAWRDLASVQYKPSNEHPRSHMSVDRQWPAPTLNTQSHVSYRGP
jgi:hypothetical protein